jgi:ribosomal protein S18 acetylase RimI-like enzyme
MTPLPIVPYRPEHFAGIKTLWQEAFPNDPPWNSAEVAVRAKSAVQPDLFLVALDERQVVGSIMAGYDGHRGWLYAAAVLHSHRGRGIGTSLVRTAEGRLQSLGCGKINLQVRASNAAVAEFYRRLGYVTEERISMGKRISEYLAR